MTVHTPQTMCKLTHICLEKLTKIVSFCGRRCVTHIPPLLFEKPTRDCKFLLLAPPANLFTRFLFDDSDFRGGAIVFVHCNGDVMTPQDMRMQK